MQAAPALHRQPMPATENTEGGCLPVGGLRSFRVEFKIDECLRFGFSGRLAVFSASHRLCVNYFDTTCTPV